ncbi:TPA: hypothetical protein ACGOTT_000502 [Streptococcus suis]
MSDIKLRPEIIYLIDGLTSCKGGLSKSGDKYLEEFLGDKFEIKWYNYLPYSDQHDRVDTLFVYPYFFGLLPENNPGRAGLEYYGQYRTIVPENFRAEDEKIFWGTLRFKKGNDERKNQALGDLERFAIVVNKSEFSQDKLRRNVLLKNKEQFESFIEKNSDIIEESHTYIKDIQIKVEQELISSEKQSENGKKFIFIGYCFGALFYALEAVGISILDGVESNDMFKKIDSTSENIKYDDERIRDTFSKRFRKAQSEEQLFKNTHKTILVYFKHFAYDARKGHSQRESAKNVAQFIENSYGRHLMSERRDGYSLIISDHNSESGRDETISGPTKIGIIYHKNRVETSPKKAMIEELIQDFNSFFNKEENSTAEQSELVSFLESRI